MRNASSNDTPRTSQSSAPTPNWRPPKAPLPPYRLAKLANALGVSTPIPANHPGSPLGRSYSESASSLDPYRRSPTPSTAPSTTFTSSVPSTSKFLLHVLPPLSFPYDPDSHDENDLPPPPSAASGYHTQFRRGILVPVHSSFQSQLSAIAKEYALPSTAGLILYLIGNPSSHRPSGVSPTDGSSDEVVEEPGPRLSEEIWKHLWTRVIQAEQHDETSSSGSVSRGLVALRTGLASRSTPHLLDTASSPLRPLMSTPTAENQPPLFNGTSPSTPSSVSDLRSNSKSVIDSSVEEPDTPDTSATSNAFQSFDLPGLHSPSLIPILAKVEFDIDRRKAVWYDPWLRNRKANHAKRAESRLGRKASTNDEVAADGQERHPPIKLIIGRQQTTGPIPIVAPSNADDVIQPEQASPEDELEEREVGYRQLEDPNERKDGDTDSNDEAEFGASSRISHSTTVIGKDPLADVFGTDAGTWEDIHNSNDERRLPNPTVVNLALTAADLGALPDDSLEESDSVMRPEEEEVRELLEQMSHPNSYSTVSKEVFSSPPSKRSSASTHTAKKHVPPPLVLIPKGGPSDLIVPSEPSPMPSSAGSANLAYLSGDSSPEKLPKQGHAEAEASEGEFDDRYTRVRSPAESEKRSGTIYDELDLGLDPTDDFDENDPNDRRRSQLLLKAQLDEIERTMAQLSPRSLNPELENDNLASASLSPKTPSSVSTPTKPRMLDVYPPPLSPSPSSGPLTSEHSLVSSRPDPVHGPPRTSSAGTSQPAWPAVPFSSIRDSQGIGNSSRTDGPPSPPKLALNGVTTSAPRSFIPPNLSSSAVSAETEKRKRELEEEYPVLANPRRPAPESSVDSPVIPLSPDPFGRYPSVSDSTVRLSNSSLHQWDTVTLGRGSISLEPVVEVDDPVHRAFRERSRSATTSRFSADSITIAGEETVASVKPSMKSTLMTVRSIKKLWRKSNNKSSVSKMPTIPSGRSSPQVPPVRPERPSQETMDLPDVDHPLPAPPPNFKGYSPQPSSPISLPSPRVSQDQYRPSRTSQDQYNPSRTSYDRMNVPNAHTPQNSNLPQPKQGLQVPHASNQGGYPVSAPSHQASYQGLKVPQQNQSLGLPAYAGRSPNGPPIVAAQMLPGRGGSSLDKFHFDQESPYPVHITNSPRYSPRPISPPALPPAQAPYATSPVPASAPAPAQAQQVQSLPSLHPEKEKLTGRKSILKAFQKAPKTPPLPSPTELQPSSDGKNITGRSRRSSLHSTKSSTTSVNDIPPSPLVQERSLGGPSAKNGTVSALTFGGAGGHQESVQSGLISASTESASSKAQHLGRSPSLASHSRASSRSSQDSGPSFDASQFEIVSPKTSTLTYPYHDLDHQ